MNDTLLTLLQPWVGFYQDPWFWEFPVTTLMISVITFLSLALPWTWLAWADPENMRKYKIQDKPFQIKEFFWPSMGRLLHNNAMQVLVLILSWPLLKQTGIHTGELPAWYIIIAQLVFFVLLDDFLYYWMHRGLHENKWLLKKVHSVHHRVRNTCAINGNYMHWIEFTATASLMLLGPILLDAHLYVVYIWVVIRQMEGVDGHAGYDIPWNPLHWLPVYEGPVYHDFHHAKFKGNYAGSLPYLDRYMGNTYVAEYLKYLQAKREGMTPNEAGRLSLARRSTAAGTKVSNTKVAGSSVEV